MSVQKKTVILQYAFGLIIVTFLLVLIPLFSLFPTRPDFLFFPTALFVIIGWDILRGQFRNILGIRKDVISYQPSDAIGEIASKYKYAELVGTGFGVLILALVIGFFIFILSLIFSHSRITFGPNFYMVIGTYFLYSTARVILREQFSNVATRFSSVLKKIPQPRYRLEPDGILLDFNWYKLGRVGIHLDSSRRVKIRFDELDDVRIFNSYQEARTFMQDSVGPDLRLAASQAAGWYRYTKHDIERPPTYIAYGNLGTNILLKGKNLFYPLAVGNEDTSDLTHAFEEYKKTQSNFPESTGTV